MHPVVLAVRKIDSFRKIGHFRSPVPDSADGTRVRITTSSNQCSTSSGARLVSTAGAGALVAVVPGLVKTNSVCPLTSSSNAELLPCNASRIPSTWCSGGTLPRAQFTCSRAIFGSPRTGKRRMRKTARPPAAMEPENIGQRLGPNCGGPSARPPPISGPRALQQHRDAPVAVPPILSRQGQDRLRQLIFVRAPQRQIALCPSPLPHH